MQDVARLGCQPVQGGRSIDVPIDRKRFGAARRFGVRAEYRLELHFDLPLDPRTRTVLGELLSQSDLTISRRAPLRNS